MHCVNRIKCCGWIDNVTFLYYPGSVSSHVDDDANESGCRHGEMHTLGNKVHYWRIYFHDVCACREVGIWVVNLPLSS